jgi:predicted short-subunit dehydrogenase-like oxidoreductase (DUF2520 family)
MLPEMNARALARRSNKLRITIVGAGNLAHALAMSLHAGGHKIDQIVARATAASLRRASRLAARVGATAVTVQKAQISGDIVWFCVPDGAIREAAASVEGLTNWNDKVALHSSGALTSDELSRLKKLGASVASLHPLMTFVRGSDPSFAGVAFAIEGDAMAAQLARAIVLRMGGHPFAIAKKNKSAYHAWGMFSSPLLDALLITNERIAEAAGIERTAAKKRMLPILRQTLANYESLGAAASFSGPIARGDVETVKKHLRVLRNIPGALAVYIALARAALRDLPAKNRSALSRILKA